jgi:hypothetical protein
MCEHLQLPSQDIVSELYQVYQDIEGDPKDHIPITGKLKSPCGVFGFETVVIK